jgi:hypothetical protein
MPDASGKPPFHIIVICNDCHQRFDMFPRGDQDDMVTCGCGRTVNSFLAAHSSAKITAKKTKK